jgi:hypothetical protein
LSLLSLTLERIVRKLPDLLCKKVELHGLHEGALVLGGQGVLEPGQALARVCKGIRHKACVKL